MVHNFSQGPPLMITPADTDHRVVLSPPQSASEYASNSPDFGQRNKHFALGFPAKYLLIPFTRSMSSTDGLAIAHQTRIDAILRSGRSCDKKLIRATSALYLVMSPPVSAWLSLASSPAICGLSLSSPSVLSLALVTPCIALILPFHGAWSRRVIRSFGVCSFQLKTLQYLPDVPLIRLNCGASRPHSMTRFNIVALFSKSASSPITCFLISCLLEIFLMRNSTADRSPTDHDVVSVHGCHDMFAVDASPPHAWGCDSSRQLQIAECRCELFLPILCYCSSPHMCTSPAWQSSGGSFTKTLLPAGA